jgi:hypothetical protein
MGLSDEERLEGMYYAIRSLTGVSRRWKNDRRLRDRYDSDKFVEVRDLIDELWHAFLSGNCNGLHWIMGSDSANPIESNPTSPWTMAITGRLSDAKEKMDREGNEIEERLYERGPFDAVKHTNISMLLTHENYQGVSASYVFEAYQWTEQLIYYLRRYPDNFTKGFEEVSRIISNIQGECFQAFSATDDFAKAYVIHEIMDILYGNRYPYMEEEFDVVTKILARKHLHHGFTKLMKCSLKELIPHHIELVQKKTKAEQQLGPRDYDKDPELLEARFWKTVEFGRSLHEFKHIQNEVIQLIEESELRNLIPKLETEFERLTAEFKQEKEDGTNRYSNDKKMQALYAYGPFIGYRLMSDYLEKEGEHPYRDEDGNLKRLKEANEYKDEAKEEEALEDGEFVAAHKKVAKKKKVARPKNRAPKKKWKRKKKGR